MKSVVLRVLPVAAILMTGAAGSAMADGAVVTLKLSATPVALTGRLISAEGPHYIVETRFGVVDVAKSAAECRGCPSGLVFARAE
ncbi:MAG: hypothetical protein AAF281_06600 [Pseudomonadota bacterium]